MINYVNMILNTPGSIVKIRAMHYLIDNIVYLKSRNR